jgi:hypothetical protein
MPDNTGLYLLEHSLPNETGVKLEIPNERVTPDNDIN